MSNRFLPSLLTLSIFCLPCQLQAQASQSGSELSQVVQPPIPRVEQPSPAATIQELEAKADELRGEKDFLDAGDYYRAALVKAPKSSQLWNKLGMTELGPQHYSEAKKCFERALRLDHDSPDAVNNLGVVFYLQKRFKSAIRQYEHAIQLRPDSASFYSNLGTAYFSKKQFEEATRAYSKALQLDPMVFERTSRSGISARMSTLEDRAHFEYVLAKLFAAQGDRDRSLEYLKKAVEEGYKRINDVYKDPEFQGLRSDARFTQLMAARPPAIPE
jgi:tetratricopeptide (TPR) repeat protein